MARCAYCASEAELHESNTPICVQCADLSPRRRAVIAELCHEWSEAAKRADSAAEVLFAAKIGSIQSQNGAESMHNALRQLTEERNAMMIAYDRLNAFLEHGVLPEDLKRSG